MATDGASPACARKHPKHVSSAMEVLSIVGYEQPITRAENSNIRATDSSGVIETLRSRKLIEADPRFGSRGRPSFLATTADFLRSLGLGSLPELPPRPVPPALGSASATNDLPEAKVSGPTRVRARGYRITDREADGRDDQVGT